MILGLPFSTFFWVVVVWLLAVVAAVVFALKYQDSDTWWTIDDLFKRKDSVDGKEGRHE